MRAGDRVVGSPKVGDQRPGKLILEKLRQRRTTATPINHEVCQVSRREAPKPVGFTVDSPTGLVAMKNGRISCLSLDFQIPSKEDRLEAIPHLDQTAGSYLESEMMIEDGDDLRECVAQAVMQPGREYQRAIAERGTGQCLGNDRFDGFLTVLAPVAMDGVLSDDRGNRLGDILGDPGPSLVGAS